ncbi:MAG: carbon starvation protein A [Bacteroidales bacterium]|nr:carbon starvation protein A [Bacteroidales bacterium]
MISFFSSIVLLFLGYFLYARFIEKVFGVDKERLTPAITKTDGVDFVPLSWSKIFLIQFLNIAGLGPIFGAVAGAMWGPVAFFWIVLGNILGGAVHDFFSGMISVRRGGESIPEIIGAYLGVTVKQLMRAFVVIMMIMVGAVFVVGPAKILDGMTIGTMGLTFWATIIFIYYILATLLPIDKIIGRIYPLFGLALLFMAVAISFMMIYKGLPIPEVSLTNMHSQPEQYPIYPLLFVSIACGAISGFHSTQSPLMARCITNEKYGRRVFYGAMVAEGLVALIWAAVGMSFWGGVKELNTIMIAQQGNAAWAVNEISLGLLGKVGAILAILGVVAAPITSGDTAFRSARLIVADFLKLDQKPIKNRLIISFFLFLGGFLLTLVKFDIIWRYMAWSNQTLATLVLWAITVYLVRNGKIYWITLIPAIFMTAVVSTYIFIAPEGFQLSQQWSYILGLIITLFFTFLFFYKLKFLKLHTEKL